MEQGGEPTVSIEGWTAGSANYLRWRVVAVGPDLLVFCKSGTELGFRIGLTVGGISLFVACLAGLLFLAPSESLYLMCWGVMIMLALPLLLFGAGGLLRCPARLDRARREVTYGWRWAIQARALDDLQEVQICGRIPGDISVAGLGSRHPIPYKLNLKFADEPRLKLSSTGDLEWTRKTGRQLAEFLKTRLVDYTQSR